MRTCEYEDKLMYMAATRLTMKEAKRWKKFVSDMGSDNGSALLRRIILKEITKHDKKGAQPRG